MKILDIKKYNLSKAYSVIVELGDFNDESSLYGNFYNYLYNLFAYREAIGKKDLDVSSESKTKLKANSVYGALKYLYEIYKHKQANLLELNTFVNKKMYSYKYPYTYGQSHAYFCELSEDLLKTQTKDEHKKRFQELYNNYLNGMTLLSVVSKTYEEMFMEDKNNG